MWLSVYAQERSLSQKVCVLSPTLIHVDAASGLQVWRRESPVSVSRMTLTAAYSSTR